MASCNPSQVPLTKETLQRAVLKSEPLSQDEITEFQRDIGKFNWLVQTTHPVLATAVSIAASFNKAPTSGCIDIVKGIYRYLKHAKRLCLTRDPSNEERLQVWSNADWAGLHSAIGDPRSRSGMIVCYGGMPIQWTSQWQKCRGTQCKGDGLPHGKTSKYGETIDLIATASG